MDRRSFLGIALGSACAPAFLHGCADANTWREEEVADDVEFPSGVVSGSPTDTTIQLLAHVTGLQGLTRLGLEIAEDPGFATWIQRVVLDGSSALDAPWHASIAGLLPAHTYYYRFGTRQRLSPIGRFTTAPSPGDPQTVRLSFFSCQGWQAGYYNAHRAMAVEQGLSLALCLGDYIYELTDDTGPADRIDEVGNRGFAETLDEYRQKYALYRSDPDLQAMHAAHALVATWDNHELASDDPGHLQGRVPRVALAERTANGKRAFFDFMPMAEGPLDRRLYRSQRLGALVELFILDLHSYAAPPESGGSYLGAAQLAWLLDGLRSSSARWKIIASSTVMVGLELAPGSPLNTNQWDGFPSERRQIVEHIRQHDIKGVIALTGDLHTFIVGTVTASGRMDGEPGLIEFCGGAISSQGLLNLEPDQTDLARALEMEGLTRNPHVSFLDVLMRGYGVLEAHPDELFITLRATDSVLERGGLTRDLARFRVRHGSLTIERLPV